MKHFLLFVMIALAACGTSGGDPNTTKAFAKIPAPVLKAAFKGGAEHTDADQIPDYALDRAFIHLMRLKDKQDETMHFISTLIPHAKELTYSLVNEAVLKDSIWQMTFKAEADPNVEMGLYVHADHQVPVKFNGNWITDVEVVVLDVNGNATGEVGGVPGQPKTKKPKAAKWANSQELDPAMPPLENVIIYLNGGKVDGERYVVGYAQMHVKSKALGLTDDIGQARVAFSATDDPEGNAFLFFDHNVTTFGNALINCAFTDGDDDPSNTPRESREGP